MHSGTIDAVAPEDVRAELRRILESREFRASKRCQEFLEYVVAATLSGKADGIKERTIAIEVFGKTSTYEPSEDASVRVKAGEVRRRLELYYRHTAAAGQVLIDLPSGYVPTFRRRTETSAAAQAPPPASVAASEVPSTPPPRRRSYALVGSVTFALLVAAAGVAFRVPPRPTALDLFWAPVFKSGAPVSLCASVVPVYSRLREPRPGESPQQGDFVVVPDQFVAVGDLNAVTQLSEMLSRTNRSLRLRIGPDVSFRELRMTPAILVGYSYTQLKEISKSLRFYIDLDRRPFGILDSGTPTEWTISGHPDDPGIREDYAIVSRLFDPDTHNMLVEIAGISHYGTEAAADLVTSPALLAEAFQGAPAGWERKNLQLVLQVRVIQGSSSTARVVATHYW
jgi:hypothetical protein